MDDTVGADDTERVGGRRMDYGLGLPSTRPRASRELIDAAAEVAEELGFGTVWATDHLVVERRLEAEFGRVYEAIATLAFVAGRRPSVRLGTSVIVVPLRNGIELAKQLATLDDLSGGRLIVGVGVGRRATEFENLGLAGRFGVRGAYLDETIALWRHLWAGRREPFEGHHYRLTDYAFEPLPPQGAALPIWVGGSSAAALRRAGRLADGYQSVPTSPAAYEALARGVSVAAAETGRARPALSVRTRVLFDEVLPDPPAADAADRWLPQAFALRGSPAEIARQVVAYADLGVSHLALDLPGSDPEAFRLAAVRFMAEVAPRVEAALAATPGA